MISFRLTYNDPMWGIFICRKTEEDLSKELDLQITGAEKPSVWKLIGVRFILLPYTLGKVRAHIFYLETAITYYWYLITLFKFKSVQIWNSFAQVVLSLDNEYCFMCYYWLVLSSIQLLFWSGCWFWRYKMKKCPYAWEDASYLTQRSLGLPNDRWRSIGDYYFSIMNFLTLRTMEVEESVVLQK